MLWDSGWEVQTERSFLTPTMCPSGGTPTMCPSGGTPTMCPSDAEHWVLDGTFKSAPDMFYQLFTFSGIFNWHLPQFYGLLPGKMTLLDQDLFEELNIWGPYQPHLILMDYEVDYCLRSRI